MLGDPKQTISIKEARKILGKEAEKLSDDDVLNLIRAVESLTDYVWGKSLAVPKTGMVE